MANVNVGTTPTQLDSGSASAIAVRNTGSKDVLVTPGKYILSAGSFQRILTGGQPVYAQATRPGSQATVDVAVEVPPITAADMFAPVSAAAFVMPGTRWACFGDSITDQALATFGVGYVYLLPGMLGHTRMSPFQGVSVVSTAFAPAFTSQELGVAGEASPAILARFDTDMAVAGIVQGVTLLCGTNDIAQAVPIATWQASVKAIAFKCRQRGIPLVVGTVPPFGPAAPNYAARNKQAFAMNLWLQVWAPSAGVALAHVSNALADPATGALLTAYDADGTHPNNLGHYQIAAAFAAAIAPILPPAVPALYTAGMGSITNPLMTGTIGNTVPAGWPELAGGTGTAPVFGTRAKSGLLAAGQWAEIAFDGTASGGIRTLGSTSSATLTAGGLAMLTAQVEVEDVNGAYVASNKSQLSAVSLSVTNGANTVNYATSGPLTGLTPGPVRVIFTVPTGTTAAVVRLTGRVATGVNAKFRFGCVDLINLSGLSAIDLTV